MNKKFEPSMFDSRAPLDIKFKRPDEVIESSPWTTVPVGKVRDKPRSRCDTCNNLTHSFREVLTIPVVDENDMRTGQDWRLVGNEIDAVSARTGVDIRKAQSVRLSFKQANEVHHVQV